MFEGLNPNMFGILGTMSPDIKEQWERIPKDAPRTPILVASDGDPPRKLAKRGDKGTWTEHVRRPGNERVPTGERVPIRITEDQQPEYDKVKIVPRKVDDDDAGKFVPATEVELDA